jgi:dipeptidyl-peptidase-4
MIATIYTVVAGERLELKQITSGEFRGESLAAVSALAGGDEYAQISKDGKQIQRFSFKTGKLMGTLLDVNTARGPKISRIDGYIVSPDGRNLLVQTQTQAVYRHSFKAV